MKHADHTATLDAVVGNGSIEELKISKKMRMAIDSAPCLSSSFGATAQEFQIVRGEIMFARRDMRRHERIGVPMSSSATTIDLDRPFDPSSIKDHLDLARKIAFYGLAFQTSAYGNAQQCHGTTCVVSGITHGINTSTSTIHVMDLVGPSVPYVDNANKDLDRKCRFKLAPLTNMPSSNYGDLRAFYLMYLKPEDTMLFMKMLNFEFTGDSPPTTADVSKITEILKNLPLAIIVGLAATATVALKRKNPKPDPPTQASILEYNQKNDFLKNFPTLLDARRCVLGHARSNARPLANVPVHIL